MSNPQVYLASNSPRRRELLAQIGVVPRVIAVSLDETPLSGEAADDYVRRVALEKARAGLDLVAGRAPKLPVLGADTAVVVGERVLGKPRDREDALAMLRLLSGRSHRVLSAVALVGSEEALALSESQVRFRAISAAEARAYWETGEPADKAGGYAIQGLGALFVEHLSGSYSGVMGLPLFETAALLGAAGVRLLAGHPLPQETTR
ncbi:MAG: Maf family nucleotide pyrophosphatase [Chromatiaceae bacterium]|jgi:septum formation protein|nr:Maf family nucleotide pyrophosphatase [Chromatiaceae bacterium]